MSALTQHQAIMLLVRGMYELADDAPGEGVAHARYLLKRYEEGAIVDPTSVQALAPPVKKKIPRGAVLTNDLLDGIARIEQPREPI
jgi:hypothetical protein